MTWKVVTGKSAKTFSEVVDLGRRAKSLKVNKINSFDGLLRPGDKIDLMGNFTLTDLGLTDSDDDQGSEDIVMAVLENVEVLSAGREDRNGRRYELSKVKNSVDGFNMEFTIVTLNLTPKQVARVELAEKTGGLFAVLRHPKDTSVTEYEYLGSDILLTKDAPENVDLVLDENGNPIGRVVGDNIVDANGKIIGKVVDGKAVTFDGKPMGQIVKNVSPDDPILRVKETADIVRDADGNIIGRVVDGKIIDAQGRVVGEVDASGRAIGKDGRVLGKVEKNVALDANGNPVNIAKSAAASATRTRMETVVRDASGKVIGRVVDGKVVDANGNVIGTVDKSGNAVGLDGRKLGKTESVMVNQNGEVVGSEAQVVRDASGNVIGKVSEVVRDANGNVIGRVVDGKIIDADGNVVGTVDKDGNAVGLDGKVLGKTEKVVIDADGKVVGTVDKDGRATGLNGESLGVAETVLLDADGKVVGNVAEVVRDASGNVIGRVVNGQVLDADGNVIGTVDENGNAVGLNGEILGAVETVVTDENGQLVNEAVEVVRDAKGNIIGRIVDGKVVDENGNVIGEVKDGKVVDASGKVIAEGVSISAENPVAVAAEMNAKAEAAVTREVKFIDYIPGGTAKDGIVPVVRVRLE